jgi:hypothetical protein
MTTDVILDQVDGTFVVIEARVLKAQASDFMLDSPERHTGGGPNRRALVHNQQDGLTINFAGDYPGGVSLVDVATLQVRGDITFGFPGVDQSSTFPPSHPMIPTSLLATIQDLQSQINELKAKVVALEAKK